MRNERKVFAQKGEEEIRDMFACYFIQGEMANRMTWLAQYTSNIIRDTTPCDTVNAHCSHFICKH